MSLSLIKKGKKLQNVTSGTWELGKSKYTVFMI